jgi:hypothetical protein
MMKRRSWNLYGMKSIEDFVNPKKIKRNMRKNTKIPRKKEKPEQPVITPRIIRLPAWFESTRSNQPKEMEVVMKNCVCKKM